MKVDATVVTGEPAGFADDAVTAEKAGYDAVWASETQHDPAVMITLAATRTDRITLGTAISVAFARTPMTTAMTANDLQLVTGGRFVLGLGTQIKPHITKRFSMPWSRPAARMHEYIRAVRAIWDSWATGERLDVRGEFSTHTLMTPWPSPTPPLDNQCPAYQLAELYARLDMCRHDNDAGAEAHERGEDTSRFATVAKLAIGRLCEDVARTCLQFHGGIGYMEETSTARFLRDMRLTSIGGGADEVMLQVIAKMHGM